MRTNYKKIKNDKPKHHVTGAIERGEKTAVEAVIPKREVKLSLAPDWQRHTGHCQITYVSKNAQGQKIVHCLQDNGEKFGGIRLMRCSQDGEPNYEVKFDQIIAKFERVPESEGKLAELANKWIENYEATTGGSK